MLQQPLIIEIISVIFEILIYLFMLSLVIVFIARRKKELSGAFYHLLLAVYISDLVFFYVLSLCFFKLPGYGVLTNFFIANPWTGSFAYTFSVVLTIYQYLGQTLIAFNRFTCVWMPILHKKIWSTKWYIPVIIILPIFCVSHRFTAAGVYGLNRDGTINVGYVDKNFETFGLNVAAIIYGINTFISIALAILTIIKHLRLGNSTTLVSTDICVKLLGKFLRNLIIGFLTCFPTAARAAHEINSFFPLKKRVPLERIFSDSDSKTFRKWNNPKKHVIILKYYYFCNQDVFLDYSICEMF